jgi:hypothetical protein
MSAAPPLPVSGFTSPTLWRSVYTLLRVRVLMWFSRIRRGSRGLKIRTAIGAVAIVGLLVFIFVMSWQLLKFLRSPQLAEFVGQIEPLLETIPALILGGAFIGVLLTSFGLLLQALYLAGDMDFLLATPVPIRAVFISKLLQAILPNFSLTLLFGLPVLFGLGVAWGVNLLYYPFTIILLAALALAAAGISSVLVMGIVRLFPARRVAEILGFFTAITSIICSQSGQLSRYADVDPSGLQSVAGVATRLTSPYSPLAWPGLGLVRLGFGEWGAALLFLGLTLGGASVLFLVSLQTAERLYYSGWASVQVNPQKKRAVRVNHATQPSIWGRWLPQAVRALVYKDFLVLRRDLRNLAQLITPLIFGLIYGFSILAPDEPLPNSENAPAWVQGAFANLPIYINVGLAIFVGWMLLARLAGMGISAEGKNYWLLKASPLRPEALLAAKFIVAFLPSFALSSIFLIVMSVIQRIGPLDFLFSWVVMALMIAGNAGLYLAFGVAGANLSWDDPRHMNSGTTGCFGVIASGAFLAVAFGLFFAPAVLLPLIRVKAVIGQMVGLVAGGLLALAAGIVPLWYVRGRIARLGED